MSFKMVRLLSDLHIEFWQCYPDWMNIQNDTLILAGDITVGPRRLEAVLRHFSAKSNHVIYVLGNHEAYGWSLKDFDTLDVPKNVHILNPGIVEINGVWFIGAALWSDFHNNKANEKIAGKYIADFKRIQNFSTLNCSELYNYHHDYILKAVKDIPGKKVIVTHFLPGQHCTDPKFQNKGYPTDQLNAYFAPNPSIPTTEVSHWFFGHTHESVDVILNNTRYIANPYGYQGHETNKRFEQVKILQGL